MAKIGEKSVYTPNVQVSTFGRLVNDSVSRTTDEGHLHHRQDRLQRHLVPEGRGRADLVPSDVLGFRNVAEQLIKCSKGAPRSTSTAASSVPSGERRENRQDQPGMSAHVPSEHRLMPPSGAHVIPVAPTTTDDRALARIYDELPEYLDTVYHLPGHGELRNLAALHGWSPRTPFTATRRQNRHGRQVHPRRHRSHPSPASNAATTGAHA